MDADIVIIGAGTVGSAIAYGLTRIGQNVLVLDGEDRDFRAATANFGLVWQHGKGDGMPGYHAWTSHSVDLWRDFCTELEELSSTDLQYEHDGGVALCLGETEFEQRRSALLRLHNQLSGTKADWEMIDRSQLQSLFPKVRLGDEVVGASFGRRDGHANPLRLLSALHMGIVRNGGRIRGGSPVRSIRSDMRGGFVVQTASERFSAARIVLAAGLGTKALASQVGLDIPVRPQRGQILVTERLQPLLPLPSFDARQTREGTVMMGSTTEETGFDASTTTSAAAAITSRVLRQFPQLGDAKLVRHWSGLRIMTPDHYPIYSESETHPGAFVAQCHSGVTLAAVHALPLAQAIAAGRLPASLDIFHQRRFDVPQAA
ncbi:NAD(P)/FAD-dependent oxidoreductase [Sphingomonas crocodyli]|uniref:FAD-binding oxidoreductase n=1 Tax=Sphingomonas crocodyli TaxID=1979270 RepID=A0A437M7I9_9SPHN|nr:FAD-binding oxidoreductase [Sphingomonas crocodyli]RVT93516.1 FAD-binding oxidoreductase [Sphingomonas crocodyli]